MKFRKKPVEIEAWQYDGAVAANHPIVVWIRDHGGDYTWTADNPQRLAIVTLEGEMTVSEDDWVIQGVKGEFYPCKPDIFAASYERVGP
jgi:hypothetical protein